MPLIVLCGLAGVGKSHLLRLLMEAGHHTIDLEGLACHSGSTFGGLGRPPQPSRPELLEAVTSALEEVVPDRPTWIEDEGPFLGSLPIPMSLQQQIQSCQLTWPGHRGDYQKQDRVSTRARAQRIRIRA